MKEKPRSKRRHKRQQFEVLSGEGRRFSFSNFRQALVFYIVLIIALIVIIQLGYHWLGGQFLAWRLQVVVAETGVMEEKIRVAGMVTRHEQVIEAPADGIIMQLSPEGKRVPAFTELAKLGVISAEDMQSLRGKGGLNPGEDFFRQFINYWQQVFNNDEQGQNGQENEPLLYGDDQELEHLLGDLAILEIVNIYNDHPGQLSYYLDSKEDLKGPFYQALHDSETAWEGSSLSEGDLVERGQPLLKIVDNWQWYYSIVLPLQPGRIIADLPQVDLEFDFAPGETVTAKVFDHQIDQFANTVRIAYIIERQVPGFERARWEEAALFYQRRQGIIIPVEALLEKDQQLGVYLNQGGRVVFYPVSVVERQEDKIMVEGIRPYSLVISRPELVEEGQRLN